MKIRPADEASARLHRGRPRARRGEAGRHRAAPTRTRLLALRVLERVTRAGAYADILLHASLGRSPLTARDRALATELVYGTLRWRGRIEHLQSGRRTGFQDLDRLLAFIHSFGAFAEDDGQPKEEDIGE